MIVTERLSVQYKPFVQKFRPTVNTICMTINMTNTAQGNFAEDIAKQVIIAVFILVLFCLLNNLFYLAFTVSKEKGFWLNLD